MAGKRIGATLVLSEGNFFANLKKASSGIKDLNNNFKKSSSSMKSHNSGLASVGSGLTSLAKKATGVVAAYASISKVISFGKDAINTGMEFEQGMAQVQAISGATGSEFTALRDKAKEMGATTKFTAIESAEAMKYMGMAGWNSAQMIDGIAGIMNLAAASGENLGAVSDIVTDSLTAFGLKASDSAHFADVLAMAATKSNTNVSMLGESFKYVAPVAGAMGYTLHDTTTALGIMANSGIKASEAGTALRSVMTRLAKPTKEVYAAFDALDLHVTNSDGSMKSLSNLVPELQKKFSGLTAEEKGRYATMLAGKNAMSGLLALVNASTDDWNSLSSSIANADGTAQNMADTMNDTVSGKLTLLQSQFEGVKISIFDSLGSSKFKDAIGIASDLLTDLTPTLTNIATWLGDEIAIGIDKTGQAISWVKDNWDTIVPVVKNLFGFIAAYHVSLKIIDVANKIKLIGGTALEVGGLLTKNILLPLGKGTVSAVKLAGKGVVSAASLIGKGTVSAAKLAGKGVVSTAKLAGKGVVSAMSLIGKGVTGAMGLISKGINAAFVTSPVGWFVLAIAALITVGILVYKNWDKISAWFASMWQRMKDAAMWCWEGIKTGFKIAGDFVKSVWDGIVNTVKGAINLVIKGMNSMISGAVSGINLLINGINKVTGVVGISAIPNLTAPQIPLLAKGGIIRRAGNVIVGERGPEMLSLPRGAQVTPLPAGAVSGGGTYYNTFYVNVNADDRNAAEQFIKKVKEILDNM